MCVSISGCVWREDDGGTFQILGACSGSALPCSKITDHDTCLNQPAELGSISTLCIWTNSQCAQQQDVQDPGCVGTLTVTSARGDHLLSPPHVKQMCESRAGCTWTPAAP